MILLFYKGLQIGYDDKSFLCSGFSVEELDWSTQIQDHFWEEPHNYKPGFIA